MRGEEELTLLSPLLGVTSDKSRVRAVANICTTHVTVITSFIINNNHVTVTILNSNLALLNSTDYGKRLGAHL